MEDESKMKMKERFGLRRDIFKEFLAEFLGTFVLILFGCGSVAQTVLSRGALGEPLTIHIGFTLGVMMAVYMAGGVSGTFLQDYSKKCPLCVASSDKDRKPRGPQLSGKLLSNDISEDDRRYWTNELYWGMGLWRGGGSVYVCLKQIQADYVRCNSGRPVWLVVVVSVCEQDGEIKNGRMADTPNGVNPGEVKAKIPEC
ncbi:hypothetical protein KUCAC02_002170 [Chaenocephalus aceratus]|uniref:Uncharacterized protein n=1 Tax=Chaenocephalus aceratus TaxID=36190 RepID=A0ACB9XST1_CHAAC|nr:hypothetical protein KUCAC02_002170 [Chaenocephalus aceratus]